MTISLKYRPVGGDSGGANDVAQEFYALRCIQTPTVERSAGQTLRRYAYSRHHAARNVYDLAISADELFTSAKFAYLKDLWQSASRIWIATEQVAAAWQYEEVVLASDGNLPVVFAGGNIRFPEVSFELQAVVPL